MRERMLIFGAAGSGTSTLGRELATSHDLAHFDVDDFFWETTDPPFQVMRERADRERTLTQTLSSKSRWVLTGSICGWGDVVICKRLVADSFEEFVDTFVEQLEGGNFVIEDGVPGFKQYMDGTPFPAGGRHSLDVFGHGA